MKILFVEWASFGNEDIKEAFILEGHRYVSFYYNADGNIREDSQTEERLSSVLHREAPDIVFSFNYFPVISNVCQKEGVRYISWIYDSPFAPLYSRSVANPCNTVCVFDKEVYLELRFAGIKTVYYMPLAVNTKRLDYFSRRENKSESDSAAGDEKLSSAYKYEISFVGSLYTEKYNFFDSMNNLSDYSRGYLDALMAAQMRVQGCSFIQETLLPVLEDLYRVYPLDPSPDGMESREWLYTQYVINRKITALERTSLLSAAAERHTLDLFTHHQDYCMPNVRNHGVADYYDEMPQIFRKSKINLNITLRSIKSGVPLRAFDILGCGGFLLSNFQGDFLDLFVPGEDFVFFDGREDLQRKVDYYLEHEEERQEIAANGYEKVAARHTYRHRVKEMFSLDI